MVNGMSSTEASVSQVFDNLGKVVSPATVVTVLGIEVDSVEQVMRLRDQK